MTRRSTPRATGRRILGALALGLAATTAEMEAQTLSDLVVTRDGTHEPQLAPREHFTGVARISPLYDVPAAAGTRPPGGIVSFDAGARTAWHTHPRGQTLVVTAREIRPGDVVWIPPGVKHWHGAAPRTGMTHVALAEALDGRAVEWMEHVTDAQYGPLAGAGARAGAAGVPPGGATSAQPSAAQRAMGDVAPHLAEFTDSVLFGDVWARPGLSRRDRSLATVSALIAMHRPAQLRSHLALALQHGVTREELVGAITHLAFYAGWPSAVSAVSAVGVARQVFAQAAR